LRSYVVVLDGRKVGGVRSGESVTIQAEPGPHELHMKMDYARSRSLKIELAAGQCVGVRCWSKATRLPLLLPYWMTFGYSRYIGIEMLPDAAMAASPSRS